MAQNDTKPDVSRRKFFKVLGGASTVAATLVAPVVATEAVAAESMADAKKARYRETDHVKAFYRTNRY